MSLERLEQALDRLEEALDAVASGPRGLACSPQGPPSPGRPHRFRSAAPPLRIVSSSKANSEQLEP